MNAIKSVKWKRVSYSEYMKWMSKPNNTLRTLAKARNFAKMYSRSYNTYDYEIPEEV